MSQLEEVLEQTQDSLKRLFLLTVHFGFLKELEGRLGTSDSFSDKRQKMDEWLSVPHINACQLSISERKATSRPEEN